MSARVLIFSASAGAGHTRAAEAVRAALALEAPSIQATHLDALDYTSPTFKGLYARTYLGMVNRIPALWGYLYQQSGRKGLDSKTRKVMAVVDSVNSRALVERVDQEAPDHILCTHFLPAEVFSRLRRRRLFDVPFSVVVTDYDVHAFWVARHVETYYVATELLRHELASKGVPIDRVVATGIPVVPAFAGPPDRDAARAGLGLDPRVPVVLVLAGGEGVGDLAATARAIAGLGGPLAILAVAGRNASMEARLRGLEMPPGVRIQAHGFVTDMERLMAAADMVVTKSGGLTTSEAAAMGLPMAILDPIPGQEERNSDHFLEAGAAVKVHSPASLAYKLGLLLGDPERLARMAAAARAAARPRAAFDIARRVAARAEAGRAGPRGREGGRDGPG
ncbi:MAG: glycosyltransferase [Planctomycetes bacterium]|nr:glycosyltransferase [Planctomycetota bacterium]